MQDELQTSTMTMDDAAKLFAPLEESKSPDETGRALSVSASTGVYEEPIITAQPCQIKRNVPAFLQKVKALAQMAGEDYCYRFPVKSKDGKKGFVEGPTIVLANDLAREYMNCMVDVRAVEQSDNIMFYARFIDYETGFCMTRAFRQRKGQKTMNTDADRAADIVFQIGQSKAIRNVVVNALQTYADFAFREARGSLVTQIGKNLPEWRAKMKRGIEERKFDLKRIEASVGNTIENWLAPDIARVIAELKSIADGMASFDDMYPKPGADESSAGGIEGVKEALKKTAKKAKEEKQPEPQVDPDTGEIHEQVAQQNQQAAQSDVPEGIPEPPLETAEDVKKAADALITAMKALPVPASKTAFFIENHGPAITDALRNHGDGMRLGRIKECGVKIME